MKSYKIILIVAFSFWIQSCNKDFLKPKPLSFFAPENVYVDKAGFESGLVTVRKDLKNDFYLEFNPLNADISSTDAGVIYWAANWDAVTPSTGTYLPYLPLFGRIYGYIKNTNVIISRIDDITWDNQGDRNAILSEALFYRSYWYYRLVHSYGDVPWSGEEVSGAKLDFQTYSKWAILKKIQSDLEFAADNLPANGPKYRPSKYAALQLLSKIYMENLEFDKAIEAASAIINGPFGLMDHRFGSEASNSYRNVIWDLHRPENKALSENTEGIFILYDRNEAPEGAKLKSFAMRNFTPAWWHSGVKDSEGKRGTLDKFPDGKNTPEYDSLGRGNPNITTVPWFNYDLWRDGSYTWENTPDLRRAGGNWINTKDLKYNNPASVDYGKPIDANNFNNLTDSLQYLFPFPWYKIKFPEPPGYTGHPFGGYGDYYVYRLGETYLIRAEAYYWKGQLDLAAADINAVRTRAHASPITSAEVTLDYIFDERARELYIEEMRHTEMVRVSLILAKQNKDGYNEASFSDHNWYYDRVMAHNQFFQLGIMGNNIITIKPHNVFWPIDVKVITANTKAVINQNKGYTGSENNEAPVEVIP